MQAFTEEWHLSCWRFLKNEVTLRHVSQRQYQKPLHWSLALHDDIFREQSVIQCDFETGDINRGGEIS